MGVFANIWRNLDWSVLTDALQRIIPALLCITLHELCHGLAAYRLGDDTAKRAGRLTLNPLRHIDVVGLLCMLLFRFGWAKPVPVDMRRLRHPKRDMALVALAGPVSNLLLAVPMLFLYGLTYPFLYDGRIGAIVSNMLLSTAYLSLALAVFNIIPIPPLDGSKVLFSLLPARTYGTVLRYERYGVLLLLLLTATRVLTGPLSRVTGWMLDRFWIFAQWGFSLALKIL